MIKKIRLFSLTVLLVFIASCNKNIDHPHWVINEVMVINENSYTNDFGEKHAWIELYNNTSRTQDLAGAFVTTDPNNPKMYAIPRGDIKTKVKPHQHVVLWADNKPQNGTFHMSFKLDPARENYIALYELDGKTLIDEITVPAGMLADKTYGYEADGIKTDYHGRNLGKVLDRVTPASNNLIVGENPKIVSLKENDANGIMITITSMLVVFLALIALYFVFSFTGKTAKKLTKKKALKSGAVSNIEEQPGEISGEVLAAISAAIYEMDQNTHDEESTILTIAEVKRRYSPWSSKIYNFRQLPK